VVVSPATSISGRVVTKNAGQPCQSGKVTVRQPDDSQTQLPSVEALIDASGGVAFEGVPPGKYAVEVYCADHRFLDGPETLVVAQNDLSGLVWTVAAGQS